MSKVPATLRTVFLIGVLFPGITSCIHRSNDNNEALLLARNQALRQQNGDLKQQVSAQQSAYANLKIQLLEKDAEIGRLKTIQQELNKKIVRSQTRMIFPRSKAEAAKVLAEIEMQISAARKSMPHGQGRPSLEIPDKLMVESKLELSHGNYSRACLVAAQALRQVQALQIAPASPAPRNQKAVREFLSPLVMVLVKTSNVRQLPTMESKVVRVLKKDTLVTATSFKGHWIHVQVDGRSLGWIYFSLLSLHVR